MLWTWTELLQATGGNLHGPVPGEGVSGISIDTRTLHAGDLFIALAGDPGPRFTATTRSDRDGHDYLPAAFRAGAPAALVAKATLLLEHPGVVVADTLDALWAMARHRRAQLSATVVAVTGSSGKTTTKSLLAAALRAWAEPGSLNNHLGVPLSISRTPSATQTAVYEIGTNHPGEIAPLSRLARPQVAIVLNVHPAHIGNFRNIGDLTQEKLSIADGLIAGGVLVREVDKSVDQQVMARAAISLAQEMGMYVVAEEVETEGEANWLRDAGVGCMQGYLFGAPTVTPDFRSFRHGRSALAEGGGKDAH